MNDELQPVQDAIKAGHMELARNLLRVLIEDYPESADVWYWAAKVAVNDAQYKAFLEKAVHFDPLHHQAANELHALSTGKNLREMPREQEMPKQAPESTMPDVQLARFWRRGIATLLDLFIISFVLAGGLLIFAPELLPVATQFTPEAIGNNQIDPMVFVFSLILQAIYFGIFLTWQNGQTPGKRLLGIRVVKRNGSKLTLWDSILRNVIGYQLSNIIPGIGFLWMFFDRESRTWHDLLSGTIVVRD